MNIKVKRQNQKSTIRTTPSPCLSKNKSQGPKVQRSQEPKVKISQGTKIPSSKALEPFYSSQKPLYLSLTLKQLLLLLILHLNIQEKMNIKLW